MTVEQIRAAYRAEPFEPFSLQLANGDEINVPHREFLWVHPTNPRTIGVALADGGMRVIDLLLVASLEFRNGRSGGRRRRR